MDSNNQIENIKHNYNLILEKIKHKALAIGRNPEEINLIAVSKTLSNETIKSASEAGIKVFGENYVQELKDKYEYLNSIELIQPEWHFIGHLQTNKVKYIAPFVSMIHSVDSIHLAVEINKQAQKNERIIDILLQVNTSGEDSKSGCEPKEVYTLFENCIKFENIKLQGLMTIGSFSYDENVFRKEFQLLRNLKEELKNKYSLENFEHLSMGMSHDFEYAIEEGATLVRVGTAIFGQRIYNT